MSFADNCVKSKNKASRLRFASVLLVASFMAGCSSVTDLMDGANPFSKEDPPLPGQRTALFSATAGAVKEDNSPVSIAGPVAYASWSQAGGSVGNNPPHAAFSGQGQSVWSVSAAIKGGKTDERSGSRPVSFGGRVGVYSPDGQVSVYSSANGGRLWSTNVRPQGEDGIALGGGIAMNGTGVYAATGFAKLVALSASNGRQAWSFDLDSPARGAPAVRGNLVVTVTATNSVYAVDASNGTEVWTFNGIPEGAGLLAAASPAIVGDRIYFAGSSGEIVALSAKTGEMLWSDTIVQGNRRFAISGISDISASPVVADGVVYVVSVAGHMVSLNAKSGERIWDRSIGSAHTPVVSGNTVFVLDLDDRVIALNRKTGKIRWSNQLPSIRKKKKRSAWAGPVLAGGSLWFSSSEGQLAGMSPSNGQMTVTRDIKDPIFIAPIAVGGKLIGLSGSGRLIAFR
jgi:outer membrane protein assembly factor BamB